MSSIVKNQHYVPRFYLSSFCNDKNRIFVYDKFDLKTFPSSAEKIASEGYFYDLVRGGNQTIEKFLNAKYEIAFSNFMPKLINKLSTHKHFKLKRYEKEEIASFVAYQYIRTKMFREESVRLFTSRDIYFSEPQFPPLLGHVLLLGDPLIQKGIYENLMNNYYWIIGRNLTEELFYTSDHPFVQRESLHELHTRHKKQSADFTLLSYEISFPLTPQYNITFYRREKSFKHLRHYDGKVVDITDVDTIQWYNNMQLLKSYRQVYSQDNNFRFVKKVEELRRKHMISIGIPEKAILRPKE